MGHIGTMKSFADRILAYKRIKRAANYLDRGDWLETVGGRIARACKFVDEEVHLIVQDRKAQPLKHPAAGTVALAHPGNHRRILKLIPKHLDAELGELLPMAFVSEALIEVDGDFPDPVGLLAEPDNPDRFAPKLTDPELLTRIIKRTFNPRLMLRRVDKGRVS